LIWEKESRPLTDGFVSFGFRSKKGGKRVSKRIRPELRRDTRVRKKQRGWRWGGGPEEGSGCVRKDSQFLELSS